MIAINCTQCRQRLEMDEAFAGGVCRCQFCGTIQTVPSRLKTRPATPSAGGSGASSSSSKSTSNGSKSSSKSSSNKALYKKKSSTSGGGAAGTAAPAEGTGLDELAEIVASSGLARGSLTKPPPRQAGGADTSGPAKTSNRLPVIIGAGAAALILVVIVIVVAMQSGEPAAGTKGPDPTANNASPDPSPAPAEPEAPAAVTGPAFADVPLPVGTVVYLVDRSQANEEVLDTVKAAVYKSARSLGEFRRFQIIFWDRPGEGIVAYPEKTAAFATKTEVDAAKKRFEDVVAYGTTELKSALDQAVQAGPSAIVLTTAKGFQLDESHVTMVQDALKNTSIRIHTISVGEDDSAALKQIADKTGGTHRRLSAQELRRFAQ